jgi:hypothetical protein
VLRAGLLVLFSASSAWAQTPTPTPVSTPPLRIVGLWDSAPHTVSTARNFGSLYDLYGLGTDTLFDPLVTSPKTGGILLRLAKAPLDVYVAWLTTIAAHEFGHCQQAWFAGSRDCHWIRNDGPYALGHIILVGDSFRLMPAEAQAITAGGTTASIAGVDAQKRELMSARETAWSAWPLLVMRQLDQSFYALTAPAPGDARAEDYGNDMTNYAIFYGSRSGRGSDTVHTDTVHAAIWNLADPMTWYATYSYIDRYTIHGARTATVPGLDFAHRRWMVSTNAWLSEVGIRYLLTGFSRGHAGDLFELAPSWGEGQPAMAGRWSRDVKGLRIRIGGDVWRQRASAAPGPLETGGSFSGGLTMQFGHVIVIGDAGYKTAGVMLGQPQNSGWFWSIGSGVKIGK